MIEGRSNVGRGEIYVGAYLIRVGAPEGALVSATAPETRPRPVRRGDTVRVLPPSFPGFVDREAQIEAATAALSSSLPVEFFGIEGAGKSALLAHLAHRLAPASRRSVAYLSARRTSLDDLVQGLFQALFETGAFMKVSLSAFRDLLSSDGSVVGGSPVLLFLDDIELEAEGVESLVASTPHCDLVLASPERRLWGEGYADAIEGFEPELALELLGSVLGRPVGEDERELARALVELSGGRPLSILLTAGLARAGGISLEEIEARVRAGSIETAAVEALSGEELQMAAALAALGGVEATVGDLGAIAGTADPQAALEGLVLRAVSRGAAGRFGMAVTLAAEMGRRTGLAEFERRALKHFTEEAARRGGDPSWIAAESAVLLEVLDRAAAVRHWRETLEFARVVEGGFALAGRWGAWEHVLELALQAARHFEDAGAEAWALHQRGTRALCLGATDQAQQDLEDALVVREALGDVAGAAASRHNLEHVPGGTVLLAAGPPEAPVAAATGAPAGLSPWFFLALVLGAVALITIVLLAVVGGDEDEEELVLVADTEALEYGEGVIGAAGEPRVVVIENRSDRPAIIRGVSIEGAGERDFVVLRDECTGRTLAPEDACSIVAAFVPSAVGARAANLVFEGEDSSPVVVLRGVGSGAGTAAGTAGTTILEVSPSRVEFGDQAAETTAGPVPITFVNRSSGSARPVLRLDGTTREFAIVEDLCTNAIVSPGDACLVEVVFRPVGEGLRGAVMIVRDATTNETWTIALTGRGVAQNAAVVETPSVPLPEPTILPDEFPLGGPDRITFGTQRPGTRSTVQGVVIENVFDEEIRVTQVRVAGIAASSFGVANDRCSGSILQPGARCGLDVWFLPTDEGEQQASLVLRDGAGDVAREIVLTGTGG
jgi:hypothetical protein